MSRVARSKRPKNNGHEVTDEDLRLPPHDPKAELELVGSMLLWPDDVVPAVHVEPEWLYDERNNAVASCILAMHGRGELIDPITVSNTLSGAGQLQRAGGAQHIYALAECVKYPTHARRHAEIVKEHYLRRALSKESRSLDEQSFREHSDIQYLTERAIQRLTALRDQATRARVTFSGLDAAELEQHADLEPDWLISGVLTIDEPLLIGARPKCCKTLQLIDLAVALASETSWMGVFDVPKRRKVLMITGEANFRRTAQHVRKACKSREIDVQRLSGWLRIEAAVFPVLPDLAHQAAISRDIRDHGFDVCIIDPLYRGLNGVDSSRLNDVGTVLKSFQAACRPSMFAYSHHVIKSAARQYGEPPDLADMTGAGVAESCGQWWLVGRNSKYEFDGVHDLCVQYGGRDGQGGSRRILFNERSWKFESENLHEYLEQSKEEAQRAKEDARREVDEQKRQTARALIMRAVRLSKVPQSKNSIELAAGAVQADFRRVFAEMVTEKTLVQRPYTDTLGRSQAAGFILRDHVDEYDKQCRKEDVR